MPVSKVLKPGTHGYRNEQFFSVPRVPFSMFEVPYARRRALANHDQTPERLAQRGGLCAAEAVMILGDLRASHSVVKWLVGEPSAKLLAAMLMDDPPDCTRSSGAVRCSCNETHRQHPGDPAWLNSEGRPFLRVLCDGSRVKL